MARRALHRTPIQHGTRVRGRVLARLAKLLAATVVVIAVSGGSVAAIATWELASKVGHGTHLLHLAGSKNLTEIPDVSAIAGGVNLLLAGTDTRTGQGGAYSTKTELAGSSGAGNNDVTMLLHIAENHQSMSVISFPRDLMVAVPTCPNAAGGTTPSTRRAMLNTTLERGGLPCVVLTIEKLTGLQIPFAAEISFDGVIAMSNAVGGVTVCLATPVNDLYTTPPLHLAAGQQTLLGEEALSFVRSRHGVGDGSDLGRISNQQVFMSALARKVENGSVLSNPFLLYPLANAAVTNMVLSDTLTNPTTLVQIALALKNTGLANMVFLQYPTVADPNDPNRVIPLGTAAKAVNAALVADRPLQLSGLPGRAAGLAPGVATPTPVAASPTAAAKPGASAKPGSSAAPGSQASVPVTPDTTGNVVLPSTVTGQTADEQTCTHGFNGK
ncbi:MAG: LCP family protein [Microbacteriaceae bacterium]|nr:LCP family protein [Microbacteriaceae bacterium]